MNAQCNERNSLRGDMLSTTNTEVDSTGTSPHTGPTVGASGLMYTAPKADGGNDFYLDTDDRATTSERIFSSAFEGGRGTDLFDAFVAAVSWGDALALRGTCKAIKNAVDQRFGPDLCSRVEFWKSPGVVARRQKADQLVASTTPYSDCWSALSDPLFAPWIVRCIDTSRGNQRLRRYCALGDELYRASVLCKALEGVEPEIACIVIQWWSRTKPSMRHPPVGWSWRQTHVYNWAEQHVMQCKIKRRSSDPAIFGDRKKSRSTFEKVPNPLNPHGVPFKLYVLSRHRDSIGTFRERSADFEIMGRFSGRPLSSEVSLSPPHTRL